MSTGKDDSARRSEEENGLEEIGIFIPSMRTKDMPMDPIKCGASVTTWEPVLTWATWCDKKWAEDSVKLLEAGGYFTTRAKPKYVPDEKRYHQKWETETLNKEEIIDLVNAKVLRRGVEREAYLSRVKLFKTPKDELVARLIAECQEPNGACDEPPEFALPRVEEVVDRMRKLGRAYYIIADMRHWFYQLKIGEEFARTMAILIEGELLFMNVLAMGHRWSPVIAHSLCWAMVLHRKKEQGSLGVREEDTKERPVLVTLYKDGIEVGFISVYLDNIMVATTDKAMLHQVGTERERTPSGGVQGRMRVPAHGRKSGILGGRILF